MTEFEDCPRAGEGPFAISKRCDWGEDYTCSYCGSLSEERFLECVSAGAELGPTDKSYKVYVGGTEKTPILQTYRNCPRDSTCSGPVDCTHWTTREVSRGKFYFQHLSDEGRTRFVALLNERRVRIGEPGHFYVLPFFVEQRQ